MHYDLRGNTMTPAEKLSDAREGLITLAKELDAKKVGEGFVIIAGLGDRWFFSFGTIEKVVWLSDSTSLTEAIKKALVAHDDTQAG